VVDCATVQEVARLVDLATWCLSVRSNPGRAGNGDLVVAVSWASVLEQMLPWLITLATVVVAIGIGALLVSDEVADEHRPASAPVPKPPFLPRQRRDGMTPRGR
jgi:hypothetical protein